MRISKDKQKLNPPIWLLIFAIFGLNFQQIQGYGGKRFTHQNPKMEKCIREYPDASANVETTMDILQNIFHGVSRGIFGPETWDNLAHFYGPESQWRRAELSILYCKKVEKQHNDDLDECLDTMFRKNNSHSAKLKNTQNYGNSVALFESLILEKELALALKLGRHLEAEKIDLEMVLDILLGRTRWELHQIVAHFENKFGHKFGKKNPKNCSLSSHLNARAKKDPTIEFAYKILAKRVKQVHKEIHYDKHSVEKEIQEVIQKLEQFCGNFDELFWQSEDPKKHRKEEYNKIAKEIDNLMEIIDFGSPEAIKFGEKFEKLGCEPFFNYIDETVEMPSGVTNYLKALPISFSAHGKIEADKERKRQMKNKQIHETISLRKKMLIMSGLAGNKKYFKKQADRLKTMNLAAKYDAISTFLTIHLGQDLRQILEHYDEAEKFKNPVQAISEQFGHGNLTKKLYSSAYPKFDAFISLMMVVYGLKGEIYNDIVEKRREGGHVEELFDRKCYGESEVEYIEERAIGMMEYEQLKLRKLEKLALKMFGSISAMKNLIDKRIEQIFEENLRCERFDKILGDNFLQKNLFSVSIYKLDYGEILRKYLHEEHSAEGDNFSEREICLWQMIEMEGVKFCKQLKEHKEEIIKRKEEIIKEIMEKYGQKMAKEEKWKRELEKTLKTRFLNHLLGQMGRMQQNCENFWKLIFLEKETEKRYLEELKKSANLSTGNDETNPAHTTQIFHHNVKNDMPSSSTSNVHIVKPKKNAGGYLNRFNLKIPSFAFLSRNKKQKSPEISTIHHSPEGPSNEALQGISEISKMENIQMKPESAYEEEGKIEKMGSIASSFHDFDVDDGKLIIKNDSESGNGSSTGIKEIRHASSDSDLESDEDKLERKRKTNVINIHEGHEEGHLVATKRNKDKIYHGEVESVPLTIQTDHSHDSDIVLVESAQTNSSSSSESGGSHEKKKGTKTLKEKDSSTSSNSSSESKNSHSPTFEIAHHDVEIEEGKLNENESVEKESSSTAAATGFFGSILKKVGSATGSLKDMVMGSGRNSQNGSTANSKHSTPKQQSGFHTPEEKEYHHSLPSHQKDTDTVLNEVASRLETIAKTQSHHDDHSLPLSIAPIPIKTTSSKATSPKKSSPHQGPSAPSSPSFLNSMKNMAYGIFGGGSETTASDKDKEEVEKQKEIAVEQKHSPIVVSHSNPNEKSIFKYLNGEYFMDGGIDNLNSEHSVSVDGGKIPIKDYIQKSYFENIHIYDTKMAVKCQQICDEFEHKFFMKELANIKTEKNNAFANQQKKYLNQNEINGLIIELQRKEDALTKAHNYCTNEFKQKHIKRTLLWLSWMADVLLQFLIVKGHHPKFISKYPEQKEQKECQNWMNEMKMLESGKLMQKIGEAFKLGLNCEKEMLKLWTEKDEYCQRGGKKSEFEHWIEANIVRDKRYGWYQMLAKRCALIYMSSLSIHWCPQHQIYEMENGKIVIKRQEVLKLQPAALENKNEMHKICNDSVNLKKYQREAGDLLKINQKHINQMSTITKNCDAFFNIKNVDNDRRQIHHQNEFHGHTNGHIKEGGHQQYHHNNALLSPELIHRIRSQSLQEVPSLQSTNILPVKEVFNTGHSSPTSKGIKFIDKNKIPKDTKLVHRVTTKKLHYFFFDKNHKKIPLTDEQKRKLNEFNQKEVMHLVDIPEEEEDEESRMTSGFPISAADGHNMSHLAENNKEHIHPKESEIPIHSESSQHQRDIPHQLKDKTISSDQIESSGTKKAHFEEGKHSEKGKELLEKSLKIVIPPSATKDGGGIVSPSKRRNSPPKADPGAKSPRFKTVAKRSAGFGDGYGDEMDDKNDENKNEKIVENLVFVEPTEKKKSKKNETNFDNDEDSFKLKLIQNDTKKETKWKMPKCFGVEKCIGMEFWVEWSEGDKFWWCQSANNGNATELVRKIDELIEQIDCLKFEEICPNKEQKLLSEKRIREFYQSTMKTIGKMEEIEMVKESILEVKNGKCLDELIETLAKRQRKICGRFMQEMGSDENAGDHRIMAPDVVRLRREAFLEICQNIKP